MVQPDLGFENSLGAQTSNEASGGPALPRNADKGRAVGQPSWWEQLFQAMERQLIGRGRCNLDQYPHSRNDLALNALVKSSVHTV